MIGSREIFAHDSMGLNLGRIRGKDIPSVEKKRGRMKVKKVNFSYFLGFFISLQNQIKKR